MQVAVEDRAQLSQGLGQNAANASGSANNRAGNANLCEYSQFNILLLSMKSWAISIPFKIDFDVICFNS